MMAYEIGDRDSLYKREGGSAFKMVVFKNTMFWGVVGRSVVMTKLRPRKAAPCKKLSAPYVSPK